MNANVAVTALEAFRGGVYKKNIDYSFCRSFRTYQDLEFLKTFGGSPAMSAWLIQNAFLRKGVQLHVSKQVSDDLIASDFAEASKVENVPWVAPITEIYFEDPLLPTILLMKTDPASLQEILPEITVGLHEKEYITGCMQEGSQLENAKFLSVQLKPDMYEDFLMTGQTDQMATSFFSTELSETDNCAMAFMLNLALKVFAFASIPVYKPKSITRKQMHFGGKPGVKGRPDCKSFKVDYLPSIIQIKKEQPAISTAEHKDFRGRRGHIRWYMHERFVNVAGTWGIIPPVKNPHTGKFPERSVIKIRKV